MAMTDKKKSGGQAGPRGPYKAPTALPPAYPLPVNQVAAIRARGSAWFRRVITRALAEKDGAGQEEP